MTTCGFQSIDIEDKPVTTLPLGSWWCRHVHRRIFWRDCYDKNSKGLYASHYWFCERCFEPRGPDNPIPAWRPPSLADYTNQQIRDEVRRRGI